MGTSQIEITFEVDINDIMNVKTEYKDIGKSERISIMLKKALS